MVAVPLEDLEVDAFALVREAAGRTLGLRPFDVQVLAALALQRRHLVEMQTGDGKTLAAVFTASHIPLSLVAVLVRARDPEEHTVAGLERRDGELVRGLEVRILDDGNLTFVNRADFQVKVRGHRVELEEVESALLSLEAVEEAAVITEPDGEGSLALHAAVVASNGDVSARVILDQVADRLPSYAVPAKVTALASLPTTPTGKVDRQALRANLTGDRDRAEG